MRWGRDPGGVCMNDDRRRDPLARPQIDTALGAYASEMYFVGGFRIITSGPYDIDVSNIIGPRVGLNLVLLGLGQFRSRVFGSSWPNLIIQPVKVKSR